MTTFDEEPPAASETDGSSWVGPEAELLGADRLLALEKQLALVDRVRSLEAEIAQLRGSAALSPTATLDAEQQLLAMRSSMIWRVGRVVTFPLRAAQRVLRRSPTR